MSSIDVHTHIVPAVLRNSGKRSESWPSVEIRSDTDAAVIVRGNVFRAIDSRSWNAQRRLKDMEEDGTDIQVLSPMPELLSHWLPVEEADELCTIMNEHIAAMIAEAPLKFWGIGMVPMQSPDLAAKRLQDIRRLGLRGIEIGTHINGVPLGDPSLDVVYAAAEQLNLAIFVHPLHPTGIDRIGNPRPLANVAVFPLETAMATMALLGAQIQYRFPKLRFLLSHGGGAACWIAPRVDFAYTETPVLRSHLAEAASQTLKRFWYDTITYDVTALRYLSDRVGLDKLVIGSDYPFAIRQKRPAEFSINALPTAPFASNAATLLVESMLSH
jgi:aminocarboxymuconate-semialdehyde decarboxylase